MEKTLFRFGAVLGAIGVALGAFGAHALRDRLSLELMEVWRTGTTYQLFHAPVVCGCAVLFSLRRKRYVNFAGWLFAAGIVIFSGSLYILALTGVKALGAITPLGGLALLAGWLFLAISPSLDTRLPGSK